VASRIHNNEERDRLDWVFLSENCSCHYINKHSASVVRVASEFLRRYKLDTQFAEAENKLATQFAIADYKTAAQSDEAWYKLVTRTAEAAPAHFPKADQKVVLTMAFQAATVDKFLLTSWPLVFAITRLFKCCLSHRSGLGSALKALTASLKLLDNRWEEPLRI